MNETKAHSQSKSSKQKRVTRLPSEKTIRISVDVMGGDNAPQAVLEAVTKHAKQRSNAHYVLCGQKNVLDDFMSRSQALSGRLTVQHAARAVAMNEKPATILRSGKEETSIWQSLLMVKEGKADVAVSAGNTGALMGLALFCLRRLKGVDRPALAAKWPTRRGNAIVLDLGANVNATPEHLMDFAVMGAIMARALNRIAVPKVALMNIGSEEGKGLATVNEARVMLNSIEHKSFEFVGYVEPDKISVGEVDVVVTEGYSGNIALKSAEGTARQMAQLLREAFMSSFLGKLAYLIARSTMLKFRDSVDPRKFNGGVLLGLNGLVIKSHGGTDSEGYVSALDVAYKMAREHALETIAQEIVEEREKINNMIANSEKS